MHGVISNILSSARRLRCWNHIFQGVRHSLASKVSRVAIKSVISDLRDLFHKPSFQEYTKNYHLTGLKESVIITVKISILK